MVSWKINKQIGIGYQHSQTRNILAVPWCILLFPSSQTKHVSDTRSQSLYPVYRMRIKACYSENPLATPISNYKQLRDTSLGRLNQNTRRFFQWRLIVSLRNPRLLKYWRIFTNVWLNASTSFVIQTWRLVLILPFQIKRWSGREMFLFTYRGRHVRTNGREAGVSDDTCYIHDIMPGHKWRTSASRKNKCRRLSLKC